MGAHTPGPWRSRPAPYQPQGHFEIANAKGMVIALIVPLEDDEPSATKEAEADAALIASAPKLRAALILLADWKMRDGTPCFCPAGRNESEPHGKMPTRHSTACAEARAALAEVGGA